MTYLHLTIDLDNAAFTDPDGNPDADTRAREVADLLRAVATKIERDPAKDYGTQSDSHGATSLRWETVEHGRGKPAIPADVRATIADVFNARAADHAANGDHTAAAAERRIANAIL